MGNKRVVLASASPRRSELLRQIGLVPEILVSHVEEKVSSKIPSQVVMELARQKAEDVAQRMDPGVIVIGADTVVAVDGRILGKPSDHEEAYQMAARGEMIDAKTIAALMMAKEQLGEELLP